MVRSSMNKYQRKIIQPYTIKGGRKSKKFNVIEIHDRERTNHIVVSS
jgi:hypothetical protein